MPVQTDTHHVHGPLGTLRLGLKVLASELRWTLLRALRQLEIRQLRKRLDQEYSTLGRLTANMADEAVADDEIRYEHELSLGQVAFLRQEIAHLEAERQRSRSEYVRRRMSKWNMNAKQ